MSDADAKPQPSAKPQAPPDPEERYRYIGFGIYPKKVQKFWKSDQEAADFAKRVDLHSEGVTFDRDFSLLQVIPVSQVDKIVITIVSVMLLAVMAMPWVGFRTMSASDFTMLWPTALGTLLGGLGTAFAGGLAVGISAILGLILMIGAPIVGIWALAALWTKAKSEEAFFKRLRLPLSFGYYLFFSLCAIVILSFVGGHIPGYASWNLIEPGEKFGIGTLLTILSYGPYLTAALGLVAGVKSSDL